MGNNILNNFKELIDGNNKELATENANKNTTLVSTQRDYMAGELSKEFAKQYIYSKDVIDAHNKGIIHLHDMDYASNYLTNCSLVNLEDMLQNGTVMNGVKIYKPKSLLVAVTLATQIIQSVSSSQFGGQSINLAHLVPFVNISREKIRKETVNDFVENNIEYTDTSLENIVKRKLLKEIKTAIQTFNHQILTMLSGNGQSPFISLFMYLGDCKSGQEKEDLSLLIEEMLKQRIEGLPNEHGIAVTPTFPKLIYVLEKDNITENSKYWYLTKLAAECSAKRMVPDYISEKVMKTLKVDDNGVGHCFSPMGCLDYNEEIELDYGVLSIGQFAEAFNVYLSNAEKINQFIESRLKEIVLCEQQKIILKKCKNNKIKMFTMETQEKILIPDISIFQEIKWFYRDNSVEIILPKNYIKVKSGIEFVSLNSVIINKNISNWLRLYYKHKKGRVSSILLTTDHPLPVNEDREVKEAKDLLIGDKLISSEIDNKYYTITKIEKEEVIKNSYDISTENEYFNVNNRILSHNCRSLLSPYIDIDNNPKYWGRFNIQVITVNIPNIALHSQRDINKFWELLEDRMNLIKKAHMQRVDFLSNATSDVAPILWQHGAIARLKKGEKISKLFYDGYATISIGYAGIYEAVQYLIGESHTTEKGKQLAIDILTKLNTYCDNFAKETGIAFSIYGTPLESTTGKLAKANIRDFGLIDEVTNHEYITNSYHISPREEIDAFSKLEKEAVFQSLSKGGAISYIEAPDLSNNIEAILEVIKYIYNNIMYAEINTRNDVCNNCGYHGEITQTREAFGEFSWECPNCGNKDVNTMSIIRRTCGYLSSVGNGVNSGRLGDYNDRVFHL